MSGGEEFENTFAPECGNRALTAREIVAGMRFGAFKYDLLPPKVRRAVDEEVKRQQARPRHQTYADEAKWRVRFLGAARDHMRSGSVDGSAKKGAVPEPEAGIKATAGRRSAANVSDTRPH